MGRTSAARSVFWEDLAGDLDDPAFLREYIIQSVRIATVDAVIGALDAVRISERMPKAELARAIGVEPATIRRLFAGRDVNPTLGTLAEVAAALGLRIAVESLPQAERDTITQPLRAGRASRTVVRRVRAMRRGGRRRGATVQG